MCMGVFDSRPMRWMPMSERIWPPSPIAHRLRPVRACEPSRAQFLVQDQPASTGLRLTCWRRPRRKQALCLQGDSVLRHHRERPWHNLSVHAVKRRPADGRQSKIPYRRLELGHRRGPEELLALPGRPFGPGLRLFTARAIGGDSGARIHLPVEF